MASSVKCKSLKKMPKFEESVSISENKLELSDIMLFHITCYTIVFYFLSKAPQFRHIAPSHGLPQKFISDNTQHWCTTAFAEDAFLKRKSKTGRSAAVYHTRNRTDRIRNTI